MPEKRYEIWFVARHPIEAEDPSNACFGGRGARADVTAAAVDQDGLVGQAGHASAESEAELFGPWPACPNCGRKLLWTTDDVASGHWIEQHHCWPGGKYENMLGPHDLGNPKSQDADRVYAINKRRLAFICNEQPACAQCRKPPLKSNDDRDIFCWLKEYHSDIYGELAAFAGVRRPKITHTDWRLVLAREKIDLLVEVNIRMRDSHLQADQSIAQMVMARVWESWTTEMRATATSTLAFGLCRRCNSEGDGTLPTRAELLRRHIDLNYEGSEKQAKADTVRWQRVRDVLDALDDFRDSTASEHRERSAAT